MNDFKGYTLAGVASSDSYKLIWAAEVVEMYAEHLSEKAKQENLDSEDLDEISEEITCAEIVSKYMYKLSDEIKTKNELATLISEINK